MDASDTVSANVRAALRAVQLHLPNEQREAPGLNHWLVGLLAPFLGVAARAGWDKVAAETLLAARRQLTAGACGEPLPPAALLEAARAEATARGADGVVVRDLLAAVLRRALLVRVAAAVARATPARPPAVTPATGPAKGANTARRTASQKHSRPKTAAKQNRTPASESSPTPALDRYGRDLTEQARQGQIHPALERESETAMLIEVLCRTQKRNPLLYGPAGCGKTAVVESFACRVAADEVPELLRGVRVVALEVSALMAGTQYSGSFEERLQKVLEEAARPDVVLFVDEAHALAQAGGRTSMGDALKPALARGTLALIAATTDEEYRLHIKPDRALERRFQPVPISELGATATLAIMAARRDRILAERGVAVPDGVLEQLVAFAQLHLRSRTFPDKALDLLEQCAAWAAAQGLATLSRAEAEAVLARSTGVAVAPEDALVRLAKGLADLGLATTESAAVSRRLRTTLHGLDLQPARPRLVLALRGEAAVRSDELARAFAAALFGAAGHVITVDLTPIQDEEAITLLVGSMPGYVGHGQRLPLHDLETTPRSVVVFGGADRCCRLAAELVAKGLADGYIADTSGGRSYLSDAVVILPLAAEGSPKAGRPFGFHENRDGAAASETTDRAVLVDALGQHLAGQVDLVLSTLRGAVGADRLRLIGGRLLPAVADLYLQRGVRLSWDESLVAYLARRGSLLPAGSELLPFVEDWVADQVLPLLEQVAGQTVDAVRLAVPNDAELTPGVWREAPAPAARRAS